MKKENMLKGMFGEIFVQDYLIKMGWVVYVPSRDCIHPFDMMFIKGSSICFGEVKTKPRLRKYRATGIDYRHYVVYKNIIEITGIRLYIFFVDSFEKRIYGNWLDILGHNKHYDGIEWPNQEINKGKILWHLESMNRIFDLTNPQLECLKGCSDYEYDTLRGDRGSHFLRENAAGSLQR